ncbi:carboxypeptidase-like regulatory domain-containing protein [Aquimarina sp. 2201CG1-2-11]|uniref:carboxypeptidase-like regulatory domain-containing protein n=1 Tax=Aquimarina discodermiae TaxID=3231043 RepID=UPI0034618695
MNKNIILLDKSHRFYLLLSLLIIYFSGTTQVYSYFQDTNNDYTEYKAYVLDSQTRSTLTSASISVIGTNISTVTNDEGEFLLKVSNTLENPSILVSYLGYQDRIIPLTEFNGKTIQIKLTPSIVELSEIKISLADPETLIREVLKRKGSNYLDHNTIMTAFYRETIKRRRAYVSLSEAVVDLYKNPYGSPKTDLIKLFKARKSANYKKLDTVTLKLQGGPTSTLYLDVMKNPEILFTNNMTEVYEFSYDKSTQINDRRIYVVNFKQRPTIKEPLYFGKLYIDAETLAMTKAKYSLNVEDKDEVSRMLVRKKPLGAKVHLTLASYNIDYKQKGGKWYYSYGRIDLNVKIKWKRKLFNSTYKLNAEMAITNWKKNINNETLKLRDRLKSSIVISDAAAGFSDPIFWGEYNVIEPEKPIESAIKKIQKQLQKIN